MQALIPNSFQQLMQQAGYYNEFPKPKAEELLRHMGYSGPSLNARAPVFYVGDYTRGRYLYVDPSSKEVFGYEPEYFTNGGQAEYVSMWHPADFKIYNEKIYPETIRFLQNQQRDDRLNYSCSVNYRFNTPHNGYIVILQRNSIFLHPDSGQPLASVGFVIDITHFKDTNSIVHTIEKTDRNFSLLSNEPVYKAVYYPDHESSILSKREMEVLRLIYRGLSSKMIAEKLFVSIHTINNHRGNMLLKTNSKNISELLSFAVKNGLL